MRRRSVVAAGAASIGTAWLPRAFAADAGVSDREILIGQSAVLSAAYFLRASYAREAARLVQHLATIGVTQIATALLDNRGGVEVQALVRAAVQAEGKAKDIVATAAVKNDGSNAAEAAKTLAAAKPQRWSCS